jgi:hypothetical protein
VPIGTNRNDHQAETAVITIYARTRLRIELRADRDVVTTGEGLTFRLETTALAGSSATGQSLARMISPAQSGLGQAICRRSTITSCRSTMISTDS